MMFKFFIKIMIYPESFISHTLYINMLACYIDDGKTGLFDHDLWLDLFVFVKVVQF